VVVRDRGQQRVAQLLRLRLLVCFVRRAQRLRAFERQAHLVGQRLGVGAQQLGVVAVTARRQLRGPPGCAAAAQRQVPVRLVLVAAAARAERGGLARAQPQACARIAVGLAEPGGGMFVVARRQGRAQHQQARRRAGQRHQRGLQVERTRQRVVGVAQRIAHLAQLARLRRRALLAFGQPALARHQGGNDPGHREHGAEQPGMLVQADAETAARRHEAPVESKYRERASERGQQRRQPEARDRGSQHQHQREVGEVESRVERPHRDRGRKPHEQAAAGALQALARRSRQRSFGHGCTVARRASGKRQDG
jgi:hypothetical protein